MIAIVIFGIGMVMVATVFPVGLDLTRETVQLDLSQAATDAAMATLILRVPTLNKQLDGDESKTRLLTVTDVAYTDLDAAWVSKELDVLPPFRLTDANWTAGSWQSEDSDWFTNRYLRAFTEETGWAAELMGNTNDTAVVPGQNLPSNYQAVVSDAGGDLDAFLHDRRGRLTMIPPSFGVPSPLPRIHLADQVYPPVSPYMYDKDADSEPGAGFAQKVDRPLAEVVEDLASRRYSWTALHCMTSPDTQNRRIRAAIVVTYRGDLTARYAAQADEDPVPAGNEPNVYVPHFNLADDADRKNLFLPQAVPTNETDEVNPNPWNKDALFPRPWLVMLRRIDRAGGEVLCSNEVACLLPAGSFFVIASRAGDFSPLESFKVLQSSFSVPPSGATHSWDPWPTVLNADVDDPQWATLQIARGQGQPAENVLAWVFPPAIERLPEGYRFQPRSPVISVAQREVPAR